MCIRLYTKWSNFCSSLLLYHQPTGHLQTQRPNGLHPNSVRCQKTAWHFLPTYQEKSFLVVSPKVMILKSHWVSGGYGNWGKLLTRQCLWHLWKSIHPRKLFDATKIRCEVSPFVPQTGLYSHCKSIHTFQGLVGVPPHGHTIFLSELFTACTSDRECEIKSGFLELQFNEKAIRVMTTHYGLTTV